MKTPIAGRAVVVVIAVATVSLIALALWKAQHARVSDPSRPESVATQVDRVFAPWDRSDSPGCSLGVSRNGAQIYERGYGMANLELGVPITPASVFHVASVSKQFTAMSIVLLAAMQTPTILSSGETSLYGLGLAIGEHRGLRTIGHGGNDPGYAAQVLRYPDQGLAIAVLCNLDRG